MTEFVTVKLPAQLIETTEIISEWCGWMSRADMVRHALHLFHDNQLEILKAQVIDTWDEPDSVYRDRLNRAYPKMLEKLQKIKRVAQIEEQERAQVQS